MSKDNNVLEGMNHEQILDKLLKDYCTVVTICVYCEEPIYTWQDKYMTADRTKGLHCYCAEPAKAQEARQNKESA